MAGERPARVEAAPRLQFRLNLADPAEAALYDELRALPRGKYNAAVTDLLLRGKAAARPIGDEIEERMRRILQEFAGGSLLGAARSGRAEQPAGGGHAIPDSCFDTSQFD